MVTMIMTIYRYFDNDYCDVDDDDDDVDVYDDDEVFNLPTVAARFI